MQSKANQRNDILNDIKFNLDEFGVRNEQKNNAQKDESTNNKINIEKFIKGITDASATVSILNSSNELYDEVSNFLKTEHISSAITITDPSLRDDINWHELDFTDKYERHNITISLSRAWMAIEETGSLVLKSSPKNPTGLNFLPDYQIVILDKSNIVHSQEQVWKKLRENKENFPRTINIITGPSRTADIEHTIQLGAHGPRRLHVIIF